MGDVAQLPLAKRRRADTVERDLVVGMVVSGEFLARLRPHWDPAWHQSELCRLVAGWCVEHWDRYRKPPGRDVEKRWADWAASPGTDRDDAEDVAAMLDLASREHERGHEMNVAYLVDRAERWARRRVAAQVARELEQASEDDRPEDAEALLESRLPRFGGQRSWTEPGDEEALRRAFERTYEPLVAIPGPLGEFLNAQLYREAFVAWMAPEKRGKTALLLEVSKWAVRARRNVAYFAVGDMTEPQLLLRWASMLSGLPDDPRCAGRRRVPRLIMDGEDAVVEWEERDVPLLTLDRALSVIRLSERKWGAGRIRFQAWPNFVASVGTLERELDAWQVLGWTPDVIVTDYADNMVEDGRDDHRHRVNRVWQGHRKMAQERKAAVLTVTQTDAAAYGRAEIGASNFSEDKRKYAHVTAMGAINQDREEKERGVLRLKWLEFVRRSPVWRQVCLLGDLSRGRVLAEPAWSWWHCKAKEKEEEG